MKKAHKKALVLFSGGLDSRLVVKMLQKQNLDVIGLHFLLPFGEGCCNFGCSFNFSQMQDFKLHLIDCTKAKLLEEYLDIIKKPKYGRGSGLNPCIDCRIFMFKKAKQFAKKHNIEIIATGEVLDERPFSQYKKALDIIEKESKLEGKIIRPLSAKLLPETEAEKNKLVDRSKFLDIQGRQRKKQIQLAKKFKISYPNPGGGCLLCEKVFAEKLKPLLKEKLKEQDIQLLKFGRHFQNSNIILGRNEKENEKLEKFKGILIIPKQIGPSALVRKTTQEKANIKKAKKLIKKYTKHKIEGFEIKNPV